MTFADFRETFVFPNLRGVRTLNIKNSNEAIITIKDANNVIAWET